MVMGEHKFPRAVHYTIQHHTAKFAIVVVVVVVVMLVLNAGPKDLVVQLTIHSIVLNKLS